MTQKLTDELKLKIKQEFVEGFEEDGKKHWPSIDELVKRHDVSRATLFRKAKDEEWQKAKNHFQTQLEEEQEQMRIQSLVSEAKKLDSNSLQIAQAMLSRVGRSLQRAIEAERVDPSQVGMSPQELRELSHVAANAQKIGKLALGEATEISKVSANVSAPESFQRVMAELDKLATSRSSEHGHTIQ